VATDVATDSVVRYGLNPAGLTSTTSEGASVTDHEVEISGLSADTQYFYSVGSTTQTLAGGESDHFFETSPTPGAAVPTRMWVIGDSGTADANAAAVRDGWLSYAGGNRADLWMMLGDNAYDDGTDAEFQAAVFHMYPQVLRSTVLWPTLGNHGGHSADSATTNASGQLFVDSGQVTKKQSGNFIYTVNAATLAGSTFDSAGSVLSGCIGTDGASCGGGGGPAAVHAGGTVVTVAPQSGNRWRGEAVVLELDEGDNPVPSATIVGDWTLNGSSIGSSSGTSASNG
jgi:hypothetical protein